MGQPPLLELNFADLLYQRLPLLVSKYYAILLYNEVLAEIIGQDIYIDTSFALDFMASHSFLQLIERHDPDRILFGTDSPWQEQGQELAKLKILITDQTDFEKMVSLNAMELLDL